MNTSTDALLEQRDPATREAALMAALPGLVSAARALPAYAERLAGTEASQEIGRAHV